MFPHIYAFCCLYMVLLHIIMFLHLCCYYMIVWLLLSCTKKKSTYIYLFKVHTHMPYTQMKLLALTSVNRDTHYFANEIFQFYLFLLLLLLLSRHISTFSLECMYAIHGAPLAIYVMVMATGTHNDVHTNTFIYNGRAWLFIDNILRTC